MVPLGKARKTKKKNKKAAVEAAEKIHEEASPKTVKGGQDDFGRKAA